MSGNGSLIGGQQTTLLLHHQTPQGPEPVWTKWRKEDRFFVIKVIAIGESSSTSNHLSLTCKQLPSRREDPINSWQCHLQLRISLCSWWEVGKGREKLRESFAQSENSNSTAALFDEGRGEDGNMPIKLWTSVIREEYVEISSMPSTNRLPYLL